MQPGVPQMLKACIVWQVASGTNLTLAGLIIDSQDPAASMLPSLAYPPLNLTWLDASNVQMPASLFGSLLPDFLSFIAEPVQQIDAAHSLAVLTLLDVTIIYHACPPAWVTLAKLLSQPSGVRFVTRCATL